MEVFLKKLESNFYNELQIILENETQKNNVRPALELSRKYIIDLRNAILDKGFKNTQDEITCFKLTKPKLQAELIYFRGILIAQQELPIGSDEIKKNYLNDHLTRFNMFFEENKEFIRYSRSDSTDMDHHFFIRENARLNKDYEVDFAGVDFRWNTGYDLVLAKCIAFEKLENRIRYELFRINNVNEALISPGIPQVNPEKTVKWTDSKTSLVELIYALHAVGAINNGQIDLKTITEVFEKTFQVQLGDHYKAYHELILNNLVETLTRRMEADDE